MLGTGTFLRTVQRRGAGEEERFPFTVPAIRSLGTLDLSARVTFFVGENGSGKSTLLEAIAAAAGLPAVGSEDVQRDGTLAGQREVEYADRSSYARALAEGPVRASLGVLEERYGVDLDANSHGQSFLRLFQSRFVPGGLYLLDEPEAPLSPQSQLGLLAMMSDMVGHDAQFIVATHSPILMAFPGAAILSFDQDPVERVRYDEFESVRLVRDFLVDPERYVRRLTQ